MNRVFDKNWFKEQQNWLLKLANFPVLGKFIFKFKKMGHYLGKAPIIKITPNSVAQYVWFQNKLQIREHFFQRNEYALKLRFWLYPLWMAFHLWDLFADSMMPQFSFGFSTLTVNPDAGTGVTTVDGYVGRSVPEESWATLIAGAGNENSPATPDNVIFYIVAGTTLNKWTDLVKAIYGFDTSSLGAGASVSAVVKSIYGSAAVDNGTAITPNIDIYTSTPAANNNLANADYGQLGSISQTGSPITYAGWNIAGYNDFTFNATGISNINPTGVSNFGARNANYDVAASAPTWSSASSHYLSGKYADNGSNKPKLVITYVAAVTINVDVTDIYNITAQSRDVKFNNPTGSISDGQKLIIRIEDDGSARALTWGTQFVQMGVTLPTITTANKTTYLTFIRNTTDSTWELIHKTTET